MNTDLASYATASYLLVIEPHVSLQAEILQLKKTFAEKYECPAAITGRAGITLLRFDQFEMLEQRIIRRTEQLMRAQKSFLLEIDGFGSYPAHSIFLQVTTRNAVSELLRSLRPVQHLFKMDKDHKPHFITDPHMIIARKLLPWQYEKGWLEMSNTHFNAKCMVNHVLLLRKRPDEKKYTTVKRFQLLDVKETVIQGELFM